MDRPPLITVVVLGAFVVYGLWADVRQRRLLRRPVPVAVLLTVPRRRTASTRRSSSSATGGRCRPALLILPFPLGFRLTCYYYRKAYYRAFFWSPPGVRRARRPGPVHGRDPLPVDPPERAPPLLLPGAAVPDHPAVRRHQGLRLPRRLRHGGRHAHPAGERRPARRLHALVPLLPAPVRWASRRLLEVAAPVPGCGGSSRPSTSVTC